MLTIRVFSLDGRVGFERLRFALVVDRLHPELVLVTFLKASNVTLGLIGLGMGHGDPTSGVLVHLLDDVARDGLSAVVFGRVPVQVAARGRDIAYFKRTHGLRRRPQEHELDPLHVFAVLVGRHDLVLASLFAGAADYCEFRVVWNVVDFDVVFSSDFNAVEIPFDVGGGFAFNVDVQVDVSANFDGCRVKVCAVDDWPHYLESS